MNGKFIQEFELQPIKFQGQSLDIKTGLHYNRFRYYDSDVGMFIQRDPIGWVDVLGLAVVTDKELNPNFIERYGHKMTFNPSKYR